MTDRDGVTSLAPRLDVLDEAECFRLLGTVPFGRVVATSGALPLVVPVNFALDGRVIVFRTAEDGPLAAATRGAVVAFQADDISAVSRTGWSVAVTGVADPVVHAGDEVRMGRLGLAPWAPGPRDTYVRIVPGLVSGRHLTAAGPGQAAVRDIAGRTDLDALLAAFYGRALTDPVLRPVFVDEMRLDLDEHLPVIGAFWEQVLFRTGGYSGRTMDVHRRIHQRVRLTGAHFDRWLALWQDSVDRLYAGPLAEQVKAHAARMASVFLRNLTGPTASRSLSLVPARRSPGQDGQSTGTSDTPTPEPARIPETEWKAPMPTSSLTALSREQLELAAASSNGRSASTVYGGSGQVLRQTMIALIAGQRLAEHENPGEATVHVLHGRVRLGAGHSRWDGSPGDLIVVPDERHDLEALEDSVVLLTVAKLP